VADRPTRAISVLGPLEREQLGWVLPHEHLTVDNRVHVDPREELPVDVPVDVTRLAYVRTWPRALADNIILDDDEAALADLRAYATAGGRSIVEVTPRVMGRDLERLQWFARSSGVNVIGSTAYYVQRGHKGQVAGRSVAAIAADFVRDLMDGPVRCGAIGEIGVSAEPHPDELNVVQAALEAQTATGAPVFIHVTTVRPVPALLDFLATTGRPLDRVVLCHMDYDIRSLEPHRRALSLGLTVELDLFGYPGWTNANFLHLPTDAQRAEALIQLASEGWQNQLLMSHDVCQKMQLTSRGGFGYAHILARVVPLLRMLGGSESLIQQMGVETPARLLCWA
jgi:phosphotriesterase-related protein